jgi:tetratricopeptide (TPR) repeat protein
MKRALLVAALLAAPSLASAQPRNREFDRLVQQAGVAYEAHDAAGAVQALQRAYAIRPLPRLLFNLGRAHELGDDYATAVTYYQRFLASGPDAQSAAVAQEALENATRRAQQLDEQRRRQAEDAARAQTVEAARLAEQQRLEDEQRRRVSQQLVTTPRRITTPIAIAWGVAGVGAVAAGVLGGLALSAQSSFDSDRSGNARYDAAALGGATAIGADVALGTAVVAGAVGLVLFFTQPTTTLVAATPQGTP